MDKVLLIKELSFNTSRSSGSGGQNVNKVETKVELRFNVNESALLTVDEKDRISIKLKNRISNDGFLILSSESERTQLANKKKSIELFFELLEKALYIPKKRINTKPSKSSKEKRLKSKKINSEKKKSRRIE